MNKGIISKSKRELPYVLAEFVFFYVVPHITMSLPEFKDICGSPSQDPYSFFILINLLLSGSIIALVHVLAGEEFSPVLLVEATLAMITFLPRISVSHVLVLSISIIFFLAIESFALFTIFERKVPHSDETIREGLAKDRRFLAIAFFWTVEMVLITQLFVYLQMGGTYGIFGLLPGAVAFPFSMIFLSMCKDKPLSVGGLLGMAIIMICSILASTNLFMSKDVGVHFVSVLLGFVFFFVGEVLFRDAY